MSLSEKSIPAASIAKIIQGRSPAYPFISLGKAMERLNKIVDAGVGRNAYPADTFYQLWGISAASGSARQTMAALNHFGLVDYVGRGDDRKVKISDLGLKIALDKVPESAERIQSIQLSALTPPIHSELYQRYQHLLPADVVLLTYLTRDCGYNAGAATSLIDEYKETLAFSGLDKPISKEQAESKFEQKPELQSAKVGDFVFIEIDGVLVSKTSKRVEEVKEHEGEMWVFLEGESSAIRLDQAVLDIQSKQIPSSNSQNPPTRHLDKPQQPAAIPQGWMEETLLDEGGQEIKIRYQGTASIERYEFIRDYLDFKISRAKKTTLVDHSDLV